MGKHIVDQKNNVTVVTRQALYLSFRGFAGVGQCVNVMSMLKVSKPEKP